LQTPAGKGKKRKGAGAAEKTTPEGEKGEGAGAAKEQGTAEETTIASRSGSDGSDDRASGSGSG
ncbi:hypothetical protein LTR66_015773, partial [Elasticomyces elasticus]